MPEQVRITAVTHPFKAKSIERSFDEGVTVEKMLAEVQPDIRQLEHCRVFVRGETIPREMWPRYRPKPGILIEARAFPVPCGGGGNDDKNPMRTILSIAAIALAAFAGPALAGLFFSSAAVEAGGAFVTFATAALQGVVAAAGLLAVNALTPIRPAKLAELSQSAGQSDSPTLFIEGARNTTNPFAPVPVVLGKYLHTPPYGAKPYTEVIGDKQFIRLLFVWGVGPLSIDTASLKIGDTALSEFTGYQIEHREGYPDDEPLTLWPDTVLQEDFSVILTQADSWITRTSAANADELSVDLTFPQGLVAFDDRGNRGSMQVDIEIEYSVSGADSWQKIDISNEKFQTTADPSWLSKSGNSLTGITFNHNRTSAIRHGIRWGVPARGQYDVRIRRMTADTDSTQIFDKAYFTALRTIKNIDPISSPVPVAKTVLIIQATDQLNNVVDEFRGIVQTVCLDWNGDNWVEQETQNPASLFRHVLQGNGSSRPLPSSRIDLETLQEWHEFCSANGFKFNMVRDFSSSMWETLCDISSAGRAAPTLIDGQWSVAIDKVMANNVSHITPRNSFDFKAEKVFIDLPHAWRIPFPNEDDDGYRIDERRVYRDGYDESNATLFEKIEIPGVTNPDQIYKMGRYRIAQAILQPERWMWKQDMEYLTYRKGSRVAITHDVLLVGLAYGRIKEAIMTGSNVTGLIIDEEVTMENGKEYGVSIRTLGGQITRQVITYIGTTKILSLLDPLPGTESPAVSPIAAGDVFGFGILGQETDSATIIAIIPDSNIRAQIIAVPYREAVFNSDSEEIPEFESNLTPLQSIPAPSIRSVISDESAMAIGPGDTARVRIGVGFDPLGREVFGVEPELRVQMRPSGTGEPYFSAPLDSKETNHVFISGVKTGETWDIRIRFVIQGRLPGPWANVYAHLVIGKSTPPSPLSGMTISVFGGQAMIRWDRPPEIDVVFGGEVVFRHSPLFTGQSWNESVSIGQSARARTLYAVLPLKPGSYMARVYDVAGNPSTEITVVTTKQASVHPFTSVDTMDEAPAWLGTKDGTLEDSGSLMINDSASPKLLEGTYHFTQGMDLGSVKRIRLTTRIAVAIFRATDTIDSRLDNIDDWEDFDGALQAGADAMIFARNTDDDPAGSPVSWSSWERLDSAEFEARAFEFYVLLTRGSSDYNILISELGIDADEIA